MKRPRQEKESTTTRIERNMAPPRPATPRPEASYSFYNSHHHGQSGKLPVIPVAAVRNSMRSNMTPPDCLGYDSDIEVGATGSLQHSLNRRRGDCCFEDRKSVGVSGTCRSACSLWSDGATRRRSLPFLSETRGNCENKEQTCVISGKPSEALGLELAVTQKFPFAPKQSTDHCSVRPIGASQETTPPLQSLQRSKTGRNPLSGLNRGLDAAPCGRMDQMPGTFPGLAEFESALTSAVGCTLPGGNRRSSKRRSHPDQQEDDRKPAARRTPTSDDSEESSCSPSDGGYQGCASSNESLSAPSSCSSPSESSDEAAYFSSTTERRTGPTSSTASSPLFDIASRSSSQLGNSTSFVSFLSTGDTKSSSEEDEAEPAAPIRRLPSFRPETSFLSKLDPKMVAATRRRRQSSLQQRIDSKLPIASIFKPSPPIANGSALGSGRAPIFALSCDVMANCLSFLEPTEVYDLLLMPLSKEWRTIYTLPQDLWRVLCMADPFNAKAEVTDGVGSSGDEEHHHLHPESDVKHLLGRYRLLYASFIRCMRYLERIKSDAQAGRPPSVAPSNNAESLALRTNESLKKFLARARGIVVKNKRKRDARGKRYMSSSASSDDGRRGAFRPRKRAKKDKKVAKVKYGHSQLTARLLGPSRTGEAGNVNLPWSCAIYSIVNWMVAFADVEGIQTMCLKVLPLLLEDENQRTTAQLAGLTDIVLRGMVLFPDSFNLHTSAFHTIVLLARPLGGKEGMLFHSSMVNSSGIFNKGTKTGKNGIAVMLDSMRRFEKDEILQAMGCWSLVNVALAPSQKTVLVKLGGISAVANAMMQHPFVAEVQFRALFALINLVIPSVDSSQDSSEERSIKEHLGEVNNTSERDLLDERVSQIANLVVTAMKNFCSSEAILNRACLVLHNISLTEDYHTILLWTPNCYQMLEWCLANYRTDRVLQQSAGGTLHRLQSTLSKNEGLRASFRRTLQTQGQSDLERVHREAVLMYEQQERLGRGRRGE